MLIYSFGDYDFDGVYVYSEDNNYYYGGDFIRVDDLLWSNREPNTNEFIISNTGGSSLAWQMEFEFTNGSIEDWFFFEKTDYGDFTSEEYQDRITDNVWITRENSGPIFNYYFRVWM